MIILLITALTAAHIFTPFWWWILPLPFIYGALKPSGGFKAFAAGGFSSSLVWLAAAFYYAQEASILMPRIDTLVGAQATGLQFIAVGLLALVCGGVSCACGFYLRDALNEKAANSGNEVTG